MEQGEWSVVALQLDLLDNNPAVSLRDKVSGEVVTLHPLAIVGAAYHVDRISNYACGYLHGYADRHFDPVLGEGLGDFFKQFIVSGNGASAVVPGG